MAGHVGRRLVAALAGTTPAFSRDPASGDSAPRRFLTALAGSTPAFTPRGGTAPEEDAPEKPREPVDHPQQPLEEPREPVTHSRSLEEPREPAAHFRPPLEEPRVPVSHSLSPLEELARDLARRPLRELLRIRARLPLAELALLGGLTESRMRCAPLADDLRWAVLEHTYDLELDDVLRRAAGIVDTVGHTLERARDTDSALVPARLVDHVAIRAHDLRFLLERGDPGLTAVFVRVLALTQALDLEHALDLRELLARDVTADLDLAVVVALVRTRADEFAPGLAALDAVLTDFTTADLSGQDLTGTHLRGIRWSILTTRWPEGWETAMVDSSVQVDADRYPDLYEVRDDPQVRAEISVW